MHLRINILMYKKLLWNAVQQYDVGTASASSPISNHYMIYHATHDSQCQHLDQIKRTVEKLQQHDAVISKKNQC